MAEVPRKAFFFFINLFYLIYLFLAALGLRCCARAFYSYGESRCAGFSSCGTWAQQLWLVGSRAQAQ